MRETAPGVLPRGRHSATSAALDPEPDTWVRTHKPLRARLHQRDLHSRNRHLLVLGPERSLPTPLRSAFFRLVSFTFRMDECQPGNSKGFGPYHSLLGIYKRLIPFPLKPEPLSSFAGPCARANLADCLRESSGSG